ncbi:MAG: 3-dehydroquinate synthase, partial [Pseudomonadota bacterium]
AVAAGMAFAAGFSAEIGWCDAAVPQRMTAALRAAGLPAGFADLADPPSPATMTALMAHDKKTAGGVLSVILMRDIGDAGIRKTPDLAPLEAFLARERTAAAR